MADGRDGMRDKEKCGRGHAGEGGQEEAQGWEGEECSEASVLPFLLRSFAV